MPILTIVERLKKPGVGLYSDHAGNQVQELEQNGATSIAGCTRLGSF